MHFYSDLCVNQQNRETKFSIMYKTSLASLAWNLTSCNLQRMWVELVVQILKTIYFNNRNIVHAYGTLCMLICAHWCGFKENFEFFYISNYCFSILDTFSLTSFWLLLLLKINSFVPYLCTMSCGLSSHHFILKWKILYNQFFYLFFPLKISIYFV